MYPQRFNHLEQSAFEVINILRQFPEFASTKICVIGGLAVWKYQPEYRETEDVDFLITAEGAPTSVKQKLLNMPNSQFVDCAGIFNYRSPSGRLVQIDMTPLIESPYLPPAAKNISTIDTNDVPYISVLDLIVFKISSAGMRPTIPKQKKDAKDAAKLLEQAASNGPVDLTKAQRAEVLKGLNDVVSLLHGDQQWWNIKLGL